MPNNLKALRELYGLQQKDICSEIGVGQSTYSNYEIGITEPKISFWRAVAERYHVTLDFLLAFTDDPHGSKYGDDFILSLSEKNLVEAWRLADEKERRLIAVTLEDYGFSYQEKDTSSEGVS
jgi:transcriptional regulator with XRE-family HTH domain